MHAASFHTPGMISACELQDVMNWSWRDYHKVYSEYTAEASRLFELHKRGDPGPLLCPSPPRELWSIEDGTAGLNCEVRRRSS
jgi:hypothetical protein